MDRVEQIAKALHDGWCEYRRAHHWTFGSSKDDAKKTHPHLIAWDRLPEEENRNQDRFQAAVLLQHWTETLQPITPEMIHEAWRLWEHLQGNFSHRHDFPYSDAKAHGEPNGPQEHEVQAARVNEILEKARDARLVAMGINGGEISAMAGSAAETDLVAAYEDSEWAAFENNCGKASA